MTEDAEAQRPDRGTPLVDVQGGLRAIQSLLDSCAQLTEAHVQAAPDAVALYYVLHSVEGMLVARTMLIKTAGDLELTMYSDDGGSTPSSTAQHEVDVAKLAAAELWRDGGTGSGAGGAQAGAAGDGASDGASDASSGDEARTESGAPRTEGGSNRCLVYVTLGKYFNTRTALDVRRVLGIVLGSSRGDAAFALNAGSTSFLTSPWAALTPFKMEADFHAAQAPLGPPPVVTQVARSSDRYVCDRLWG
jgi:hypothetical protein